MDCQKIYNEVNCQPGLNVLKEPLHVFGNCFVEYYVCSYTKTNNFPFEIHNLSNWWKWTTMLYTSMVNSYARNITWNGLPGFKVVNEKYIACLNK